MLPPPPPPPLHIFCVLLSFSHLHLSSLFCAQRPLPRQTRGERTLAVPSLLKGSGCCCPRCRCRVLSTATGYCRSSRPFSISSLSCFLFPVRGYSVSLVVARRHLPRQTCGERTLSRCSCILDVFVRAVAAAPFPLLAACGVCLALWPRQIARRAEKIKPSKHPPPFYYALEAWLAATHGSHASFPVFYTPQPDGLTLALVRSQHSLAAAARATCPCLIFNFTQMMLLVLPEKEF